MIFLAMETAPREQGETEDSFRSFQDKMTKVNQTIFQHVYLECDVDNVSVSHSLSWKSYFTFGWIYFSVQKRKKNNCFEKVVASFSRKRTNMEMFHF